MKNLQKGFAKTLLVIIAMVLIIGGGIFYLSSKGNFCFIKINDNCMFGKDNSGITNVFRVPIKPGDTQQDIIKRIEGAFSKFSNEYITARFINSNGVFKSGSDITGQVLSKDWATLPNLQEKVKDRGTAGTVEIYDANNNLIVRRGLNDHGGSQENGQLVVPFSFSAIIIEFSKPSTRQGKIILYDTDRNIKTSLDVPINFW